MQRIAVGLHWHARVMCEVHQAATKLVRRRSNSVGGRLGRGSTRTSATDANSPVLPCPSITRAERRLCKAPEPRPAGIPIAPAEPSHPPPRPVAVQAIRKRDRVGSMHRRGYATLSPASIRDVGVGSAKQMLVGDRLESAVAHLRTGKENPAGLIRKLLWLLAAGKCIDKTSQQDSPTALGRNHVLQSGMSMPRR